MVIFSVFFSLEIAVLTHWIDSPRSLARCSRLVINCPRPIVFPCHLASLWFAVRRRWRKTRIVFPSWYHSHFVSSRCNLIHPLFTLTSFIWIVLNYVHHLWQIPYPKSSFIPSHLNPVHFYRFTVFHTSPYFDTKKPPPIVHVRIAARGIGQPVKVKIYLTIRGSHTPFVKVIPSTDNHHSRHSSCCQLKRWPHPRLVLAEVASSPQ